MNDGLEGEKTRLLTEERGMRKIRKKKGKKNRSKMISLFFSRYFRIPPTFLHSIKKKKKAPRVHDANALKHVLRCADDPSGRGRVMH